MKCPEIRPALASFANGSLDPRERGSVQDHLEGCPACAEEFRRAHRLIELVGSLPSGAPAELDARVLQAARTVARSAAAGSNAGPGAAESRTGGGVTTIPCRQVLDDLVEHLDGVLPVDRAIDVALHLDGCPSCTSVFHRAEAIVDALPSDRATAPEEIWDRIRPELERVHAAAARHPMRPLLPAEGLPELARFLPIGTAAAAAVALVAGGSWLLRGSGDGAILPHRRGPEIRFTYVDRPIAAAVQGDPMLRALIDGFRPAPPRFPDGRDEHRSSRTGRSGDAIPGREEES